MKDICKNREKIFNTSKITLMDLPRALRNDTLMNLFGKKYIHDLDSFNRLLSQNGNFRDMLKDQTVNSQYSATRLL